MSLRIFKGKNCPQKKKKKNEYEHLGSCCIKSTLCKRFLKLNQIFKKSKVVTGRSSFFVIGPFCTPHSVCLNIGFW